MQFFRQFQQSQFLRQNAIFFAGSLAVGVLNYLYYPVLGRMLMPSNFGEVQTLVSLFLQATIFLNVLSLITINIVVNYKDAAHRNKLIFELEKLALLASLVVLVLTLCFGAQLQQFLRFDSSAPFVAFALSLVVSVPFTFRSAYLRGQQRFGLTVLANLIGAGGKLLCSMLLVVAGFGPTGAIAGIALAQLVALAYEAIYTQRLGLVRSTVQYWRLPDLRALLPELRYSVLVLIGSLVMMTLFSIDVVLVKHYFDATTAGYYAGIATVARIIFFLTLSVSQVLLPSVQLLRPAQENRRALMRSMVLLVITSAPVLLVFMVVPNFIVERLMGANYEQLAHLLPPLGGAIMFISLINLLVMYYVALRRYWVAGVVLGGGFITVTLMLTNRHSLEGVVYGLLEGSAVMLGVFGVWMFRAKLARRMVWQIN